MGLLDPPRGICGEADPALGVESEDSTTSTNVPLDSVQKAVWVALPFPYAGDGHHEAQVRW